MLISEIIYEQQVFKVINNKLSGEDFFLPKRNIPKKLRDKVIIPINKVLRTPNRNELCNCNSGVKYKKCCGK